MNTINQLSFFEDLISLKIMLVLYRDNPDILFDELKKEINIDTNALSEKLAGLISADLISVRTERNIRLFTLSEPARMSLNRLGVKDKLK